MRQRCYFQSNEREMSFILRKMSPLSSVIMVLTTLLLGREKAFRATTAAALVGRLAESVRARSVGYLLQSVMFVLSNPFHEKGRPKPHGTSELYHVTRLIDVLMSHWLYYTLKWTKVALCCACLPFLTSEKSTYLLQYVKITLTTTDVGVLLLYGCDLRLK